MHSAPVCRPLASDALAEVLWDPVARVVRQSRVGARYPIAVARRSPWQSIEQACRQEIRPALLTSYRFGVEGSVFRIENRVLVQCNIIGVKTIRRSRRVGIAKSPPTALRELHEGRVAFFGPVDELRRVSLRLSRLHEWVFGRSFYLLYARSCIHWPRPIFWRT
jgi:hypothetical protein